MRPSLKQLSPKETKNRNAPKKWSALTIIKIAYYSIGIFEALHVIGLF